MIRYAVVMAVGCSKEPPPKPPTVYEQYAARITALEPVLDGLDKQLTATKGNCKAAMQALADFGARHRNDVLALRPLVAKFSGVERSRAIQISPKLMSSSMKIQGLPYQCPNESEMVTAIEKAGFLPTAEALP